MKELVIIGTGWSLSSACALAAHMGRAYRAIELQSTDGFSFDWRAALAGNAQHAVEVFVAVDSRAVNSVRAMLLEAVVGEGFALANLLAPDAYIADSASLGRNVYVGPGCRLLESVKVGHGVWLDAAAVIECAATIGESATVGAGVIIEQSASVGHRSTLSSGSRVPAAGKVGDQSEWLLGGRLPPEVQSRSFHDETLPEGAVILTGTR